MDSVVKSQNISTQHNTSHFIFDSNRGKPELSAFHPIIIIIIISWLSSCLLLGRLLAFCVEYVKLYIWESPFSFFLLPSSSSKLPCLDSLPLVVVVVEVFSRRATTPVVVGGKTWSFASSWRGGGDHSDGGARLVQMLSHQASRSHQQQEADLLRGPLMDSLHHLFVCLGFLISWDVLTWKWNDDLLSPLPFLSFPSFLLLLLLLSVAIRDPNTTKELLPSFFCFFSCNSIWSVVCTNV